MSPEVALDEADPAVSEAISEARRAVWWRPRSAAAWGRLGQLLRAHGFVQESNVCFSDAAHFNPDEPRWHYYLGLGLISTDPDAAIVHFERAVNLCGGVPSATELRLADVCLQQGRLDQAERHFLKVKLHDPENARAQLGLGRLAFERSDFSASLGYLERAAANPKAQKEASALRARILQQLGESAAADKERARVAELPDPLPWPDPFVEEIRALMIGKQALLDRLKSMHRQGRGSDAQALARQLETDYPDIFWLVEGRAQMNKGNLTAAAHALRESIRLAPNSIDAHFDLAMIHLQQKNYELAADGFRKVTELEPGYGPAYQRLGQCLLALDQRAEAIVALQAAVRFMPHNKDAQRELADVVPVDKR